MAVIGKIRSYSGLLIAVIGIALAAFVLGDFMGYGPTGARSMEVATVENHKIMYQEFENQVATQTENWKQQTGNQSLNTNEAFQIRQQVYNQLVREILLGEQFNKLGIDVSADELTDLFIGNDPHSAVVQSFTDPQTGQFDSESVIQFIQNMDNLPPGSQQQWMRLEEFVKQQAREEKYHSMISKAYYAPDTLAGLYQTERSTTLSLKLVAKRYNTIPDTTVNLTDSDLRNAYDENKYDFRQEKARDLQYVVFPVFPSEEDRENIRTEVERLKNEMQNDDDVISFVNSNSDTPFDPTFYSREELSPEIDSIMFNAETGFTYGPYQEDNAFVVARLQEIEFRPDSMQASHILIAYLGSRSATQETTLTRDEAQAKADSILEVVRRSPGQFSQIAADVSDDPSAAMNQGDLGWFKDGDMVPEFNEAVMNNPVNTFTIAESDFGYHIIRITGKSTPTKKVQIAKLTRNIEYSNQTYQQEYGKASRFAAALRENKDFDTAAEEQGVSKRVVDDLNPMDNSIPGIENPRTIIQWAFNDDTDEGDFSQIYDLEGKFVVAMVTDARDEGIPSLGEIEEEIREIALRNKKALMIKEEFAENSGQSIDQIAESMNLTAQTIDNVRFTLNNLQGFGAEPKVIGAAFAMEPNTVSKPIQGQSAVFVIEVTNINQQEINATGTQAQMQNNFRNRVPNETFRALEESADIDDNRHRFY